MSSEAESYELETVADLNLEKILDLAPLRPENEAYRVLYTGTTKEDFNRKVEESNGQIEDWDGEKLWFTPRLHDHPHSAIYYAGQALKGGRCRDWDEAETPVLLEWTVPESEIEPDPVSELPDSKRLAHISGTEEYWGRSVPRDWLVGHYEPNGGPRLKEGYELDMKGWDFEEYDGGMI